MLACSDEIVLIGYGITRPIVSMAGSERSLVILLSNKWSSLISLGSSSTSSSLKYIVIKFKYLIKDPYVIVLLASLQNNLQN